MSHESRVDDSFLELKHYLNISLELYSKVSEKALRYETWIEISSGNRAKLKFGVLKKRRARGELRTVSTPLLR